MNPTVGYMRPDRAFDKVKVRVGYDDGHNWLEEYTEEHAAAGLVYVEIDLHVWKQYAAHRDAAMIWHSYCLALDNQLYEKEQEAHERSKN